MGHGDMGAWALPSPSQKAKRLGTYKGSTFIHSHRCRRLHVASSQFQTHFLAEAAASAARTAQRKVAVCSLSTYLAHLWRVLARNEEERKRKRGCRPRSTQRSVVPPQPSFPPKPPREGDLPAAAHCSPSP